MGISLKKLLLEECDRNRTRTGVNTDCTAYDRLRRIGIAVPGIDTFFNKFLQFFIGRTGVAEHIRHGEINTADKCNGFGNSTAAFQIFQRIQCSNDADAVAYFDQTVVDLGCGFSFFFQF